MFDEKLDLLDMVIASLIAHEKNLDGIIKRLEKRITIREQVKKY
jgi:hypothetical protein